jgi:inhibitor of cysteine peptidase
MNTPFRVLAGVGILIVAATGCEQGKRPDSTGPAVTSKAEKVVVRSKGVKAHAKAGGAAHKTAAADNVAPASSGRRVSTLTLADDGRTFELHQGQVLSVALESNRSSGSSWNMVEPTQSVIELDGKPVYVTRTARTGSGGTETWHFRAVRSGRQTVRLEYRRAWARNVPERAFRFTAMVR